MISAIPQKRLHNQHIADPQCQTAADVVASLGAMQGQDYPGAKWSIGLRLPGSTDSHIEQAFIDKQIVRTWANRGTLHIVAAADLCWMINLIGPRVIAGNARRYKQLELDAETLRKSVDIFVDALDDGKILSRKALLQIVEENGISAAGQRGVYMLQRACIEGLICQGIEDRRNPMFYRVDTLPFTPKRLSREESLAELAQRYFISHGPATIYDFAWWTGLTITDSRIGLEAIKSQLVEEVIDNTSYWVSPKEAPNNTPRVFALPGFDEYILGYKDRNAVLDLQFADAICPGGNGMFFPTIVVDGQVVGTWKRTLKKNVISISTTSFTSLTEDDQDAFAQIMQHYGEFMGASEVLV